MLYQNNFKGNEESGLLRTGKVIAFKIEKSLKDRE